MSWYIYGYYQVNLSYYQVNFQAILLISSGETSANRDIFITDDAAKKFFPTPKI